MPGVENVVLVDLVDPEMTVSGDVEGNRQGIQVDLNVPVNMEEEDLSVMVQQSSRMKEVL